MTVSTPRTFNKPETTAYWVLAQLHRGTRIALGDCSSWLCAEVTDNASGWFSNLGCALAGADRS